MAIGTPGSLNTEGKMKSFDPVLRKKTLPTDIFGMSRQYISDATVKDGRIMIEELPKEIFLDISSKFAGGNIKSQIQFIGSLNGDGARGYTAVEGNATYEEAQAYKGLEVTANMTRKAVPLYDDGPSAHELKGYGARRAANEQLSQWAQDDFGYGARHAINEFVEAPLESAPATITTKLHPRIYCAGTAIPDTQQPASNYSATSATYQTAVGAGANLVPSDANGGITFDTLAQLSEFCKNAAIRKLSTSRGAGWVLAHSTKGTVQMLRNKEMREMLQHADVRGPSNQLMAGLKGPIFGFYFYEDEKLSRIKFTGTESAWTAAFSYYMHGTTDNRDGDFDVNMILGPGALLRGNAIAPHYREGGADQDYGVKKGICMSYTRALYRLQYDQTAAGASTWVCDGSALWLTRR
jgi:hypothetical protein